MVMSRIIRSLCGLHYVGVFMAISIAALEKLKATPERELRQQLAQGLFDGPGSEPHSAVLSILKEKDDARAAAIATSAIEREERSLAIAQSALAEARAANSIADKANNLAASALAEAEQANRTASSASNSARRNTNAAIASAVAAAISIVIAIVALFK